MQDRFDYHKAIEDKVANMLESRGYHIRRNQTFDFNGIAGECDIIASNGKPKYVLIFEVKRRENKTSRSKVREQLGRDNEFIRTSMGENIRCFNFFVYSSNKYELGKTNKAYTIEWIRGKLPLIRKKK